MLSIKDQQNGSSVWLKVGQTYGVLKLQSFNSVNSTATLSYDGQLFELKISQYDGTPLVVINPEVHTEEILADINQKVEAYRKGLSQILATPDAGPRSSGEQQKLEQDIQNAVANYRQQLMVTTDQQPSPTSISDGIERHGLGVRRHNRVNSRIWASDHIEKYGEPDENGELIVDAPVSD